uniref:Uncharacterized protein n=1 Tax=Trichuris muris TaxID=70415 RepID=A0A5S6R545_TRIMR
MCSATFDRASPLQLCSSSAGTKRIIRDTHRAQPKRSPRSKVDENRQFFTEDLAIRSAPENGRADSTVSNKRPTGSAMANECPWRASRTDDSPTRRRRRSWTTDEGRGHVD